MKHKVLVVDDEPDILEMITAALQGSYTVLTAMRGGEALSLALEHKPDIVVLDLGLPDLSGLDVCRLLKKDKATCGIPVLMLTARTRTEDKITGLDSGADDYLTKPFEPRELLARLRALIRRMDFGGETDQSLERGAVRVDLKSVTVRVNGQDTEPLTRREFDLLYCLMKKSPRVFSRKELVATIWGMDAPVTSRTVDATVKRLRAKLGNAGAARIKTVEGFGYCFEG